MLPNVVLHFGRKDNTYDYYMSNQNHMCKIVSTSHEKDIGVIFDDNLLFDSHIATTVNKCQGILSIINPLTAVTPESTRV